MGWRSDLLLKSRCHKFQLGKRKVACRTNRAHNEAPADDGPPAERARTAAYLSKQSSWREVAQQRRPMLIQPIDLVPPYASDGYRTDASLQFHISNRQEA
jgi:hypothetical protein